VINSASDYLAYQAAMDKIMVNNNSKIALSIKEGDVFSATKIPFYYIEELSFDTTNIYPQDGDVYINNNMQGFITKEEQEFLWVCCKELEIDYYLMIAISMHECSLGTYSNGDIWAGQGSEKSINGGTGYLACNLFPQAQLAAKILQGNEEYLELSSLAIQLDGASVYSGGDLNSGQFWVFEGFSEQEMIDKGCTYYAKTCSRDYNYGNLVIGVVSIKEWLLIYDGDLSKALNSYAGGNASGKYAEQFCTCYDDLMLSLQSNQMN
jgi:hypothetical protein